MGELSKSNRISQIDKYAQGLKELIKEAFTGDVVIEEPNTQFMYATEETNNKLKFPMITLYQNNDIRLANQYNSFAQYKEGFNFEYPLKVYNEDGTLNGKTNRLAKNAKVLYILISYQIDVWATNKQEVSDTAVELLFYLLDNQTVSIELLNETLEFSFTVSPQILDNSDLTTYTTNGKLYRYTMSVEVLGTVQQTKNFFTLLHPNTNVEVVSNPNPRVKRNYRFHKPIKPYFFDRPCKFTKKKL